MYQRCICIGDNIHIGRSTSIGMEKYDSSYPHFHSIDTFLVDIFQIDNAILNMLGERSEFRKYHPKIVCFWGLKRKIVRVYYFNKGIKLYQKKLKPIMHMPRPKYLKQVRILQGKL